MNAIAVLMTVHYSKNANFKVPNNRSIANLDLKYL